jgi:hypothetical protein
MGESITLASGEDPQLYSATEILSSAVSGTAVGMNTVWTAPTRAPADVSTWTTTSSAAKVTFSAVIGPRRSSMGSIGGTVQ